MQAAAVVSAVSITCTKKENAAYRRCGTLWLAVGLVLSQCMAWPGAELYERDRSLKGIWTAAARWRQCERPK